MTTKLPEITTPQKSRRWAWLMRFVRFFKAFNCKHSFNTREIRFKIGEDENSAKRVFCACHKCGELFHANCGLELDGELTRF